MRALLLALVIVAVAVPGHAVPITACGDSVPAGETGDLMNDLTCTFPGGFGAAVFLGDRSTLNLTGFRITGDGPDVVPGTHIGVFCGARTGGGPRLHSCAVNGPGEVTNLGVGLFGDNARRMTVRDVTLRGNGDGLAGASADLLLTNVVADGNTETGIYGNKVVGTGIQVNDNGEGGLGAERVTVTGLTATGNGSYGGLYKLGRGRVGRLTDANVTGNDGRGQGYDITWEGPLLLTNTVCGKSARLKKGVLAGSYQACTND
jgi:hypothetical protein